MKFLAFIAGLFFILSSHFAAGMPSQASPVQSFETALQSQSSLDYVAMSKGMTENSGASFWKSRIFRRILIVMSVAVLSMLLIILCVIVLFKVMPGFQYTVTAFLESVFRKKTLHDALQKNDMKELRWLIKKGEDVNLKDGWKGFTPLHLAVDENKEEMVKVLISEGAHIDAPDSMGKTPIFYAHTIEMAELLISTGSRYKRKKQKRGYCAAFSPFVEGKGDSRISAHQRCRGECEKFPGKYSIAPGSKESLPWKAHRGSCGKRR